MESMNATVSIEIGYVIKITSGSKKRKYFEFINAFVHYNFHQFGFLIRVL